MNWELFYQLNRAWLDLLLYGAVYFSVFAGLMLSMKLIEISIKKDKGE